VKWGGVTAAEAKKMTKEADKFKEADKKARAITEARVKGLDAVIELEKELASLGEFISEPGSLLLPVLAGPIDI
jgi:molecular chaperone DnaK (HSP70)